ncbi:MAG: hypothetical protein ACXQS8_08760 [Candidatus Helarchaeales archaeon]
MVLITLRCNCKSKEQFANILMRLILSVNRVLEKAPEDGMVHVEDVDVSTFRVSPLDVGLQPEVQEANRLEPVKILS